MGDAAKGYAVPFNSWLSEAMPEGGAACVCWGLRGVV